jgi:hypothetical protein
LGLGVGVGVGLGVGVRGWYLEQRGELLARPNKASALGVGGDGGDAAHLVG